MLNGVADSHALKVVNLTAAQNGGQNLVFLRGGENEDDMCGWLLQCLQESIEGRRRQHVYLVDDKHLVLAYLRRDARLFHQRLDVLHGIVGGGIKLENIEGTLFVERLTGFTMAAGLTFGCRSQAVDGFGENTGTGCLSDTTWTAEQVGMGQFPASYGVFQCCGQCLLSHYGVKRGGAVFSR